MEVLVHSYSNKKLITFPISLHNHSKQSFFPKKIDSNNISESNLESDSNSQLVNNNNIQIPIEFIPSNIPYFYPKVEKYSIEYIPLDKSDSTTKAFLQFSAVFFPNLPFLEMVFYYLSPFEIF